MTSRAAQNCLEGRMRHGPQVGKPWHIRFEMSLHIHHQFSLVANVLWQWQDSSNVMTILSPACSTSPWLQNCVSHSGSHHVVTVQHRDCWSSHHAVTMQRSDYWNRSFAVYLMSALFLFIWIQITWTLFSIKQFELARQYERWFSINKNVWGGRTNKHKIHFSFKTNHSREFSRESRWIQMPTLRWR